MSDIKLFRISGPNAVEVERSSVALERSLQQLIESHLHTIFAIRFLASEYPTDQEHGGRMDTLGIDENQCPVIIEYKRTMRENVINQGLFYLDWLMNHKRDFEWLVRERISEKDARNVEWLAPRLLCIAQDFTKYDEYAIKQMNRNIELIRYRKYSDDLFMFELVNTATEKGCTGTPTPKGECGKRRQPKTIEDVLEKASPILRGRFGELKAFALSLGDDSRMETMKGYFAFKRLRNFTCVKFRSRNDVILVYMTLNPETIPAEKGFTRDVRKKSTGVPGGLELTIRSDEDLQKAIPLIERNYDRS